MKPTTRTDPPDGWTRLEPHGDPLFMCLQDLAHHDATLSGRDRSQYIRFGIAYLPRAEQGDTCEQKPDGAP